MVSVAGEYVAVLGTAAAAEEEWDALAAGGGGRFIVYL